MIEKYRKVLENIVSNIGLVISLSSCASPTYMSQTTSHQELSMHFPPQMFLLLPNRANTRSSFQALVLGQRAGNAVEHYKQSKYSKMPSTAHIQESDKQFKCTTSKSFFQEHCKQCKYSKMPSTTHFQENALRLNLFFKSITNNQTMQISEHADSSSKKMQTTQIHS